MADSTLLALRRARRAAIALVALAALGACSGSAPQCSQFSNECTPDLSQTGSVDVPYVFIDPRRLTAQAGATAVFTAQTNVSQPAFQWQRSADAGHSFTDIPGATASTLTLGGVRIADDATVLRVVVQGGSAPLSVTSTLLVSSMPAVDFHDGEFADADWSDSDLASPAQAGATHAAQQQASGGNNGAYRAMTDTLPAAPTELLVFHAALSATWDPATQGAIHAVDQAQDCIRQNESTAGAIVASMLSLQQAGRRYVASAMTCPAGAWSTLVMPQGLAPADFVLVDGPACASGESCPDFSATGAPLQFGYARRTTLAAGKATGVAVHGIDNWLVTIWRP